MRPSILHTSVAVVLAALAAAAATAAGRAATQPSPLIAFISDRGGTPALYTMKTDGTNQQRIASEAGALSWTADGSTILIKQPNALIWMKPDGLSHTTISPAYSGAWSPDGKRAAYLTSNSCHPNGCELDAVAGDDWVVASVASHATGVIAWAPDGRHFAYVDRGPGGDEVWTAESDGGQPTKVASATSASQSIESLQWLAGNQLVYVAREGAAWFGTVDLEDGGSTLPRIHNPIGLEGSVLASPDGERFALVQSSGWATDYFVVYDLTQSLAASAAGFAVPQGLTWSPDGSGLAYAGCVATFTDPMESPSIGSCALRVSDVGRPTSTTLVDGPSTPTRPWFGGLSWALDSATLAVSALDPVSGSEHLAVVDRDGSNLHWLTSGTQNDTAPAWQPVVPPQPPTPGPSELAPNPGFEGDIAADWRSVVDRGAYGGVGPTTSFVHGGSQAASLGGDWDDANTLVRVLSRQIPVRAGHNYHFSAYLRAFNLQGEGRIDVTFWDANGAYIPDSSRSSADYGQTVTGTSGWTQVALDERAPGNAATVRLEIRVYGGGGHVTAPGGPYVYTDDGNILMGGPPLYVDDVSLTATD